MITLITIYQKIKRMLGLPFACRFSPSCSEYAKEAIRRHGIIRGSVLGVGRILKCHPWSPGGHDPVPD